MGTYLEALIRHTAGAAEVRAAYAGGSLGLGQSDPFGELELYLVAPPAFEAGLLAWLSPLGETAYAEPVRGGCRIITLEGLPITLQVVSDHDLLPAGQVSPLFDRTGREAGEQGASVDGGEGQGPDLGDLAAEAARFWHDLFGTAAAIGRGQPLTAHGGLEACRLHLINLYRLALAPGSPGRGWKGSDQLPGGERLLESLSEWLVCPLEVRAQWRCANRLATTYESLMLPLTERLKLPYPWAMRNLVFQRLDEIRPDRPKPEEGTPAAQPTPPPPPPEPEQRPAGPARFKVKVRRPAK